MTVTEAPRSAPAAATTAAPPQPRGLPAVLGTGDHKTVGRVWIGASALFLLVTVVAGSLLGVERITLDQLEVLGDDHALQIFSLYRIGITFLVVLPLFLGLATFVVPLQVGASSLAFPRAAAAGLWTWLGGAALLLTSYAIDGGPPHVGADTDAVALWVLALGLVIIGLLVASLCVVTTILALRTPRMTLLQVPPFSWSMLIAGVVWLLSLPVLLGGLLLAYLDYRYGQLLFGAPEELYERLRWTFDQPQVYVMAIPVLGVAAEIVPVSTGVVQRQRGAVWAGIAGFGIFAFGAWAQPFYRPALLEEGVYIAVAFAIGLPLLVVLGGLADCAKRGTPRQAPALLLTAFALLILLGAVAAGAAAVVESFDLLGTTWQVGHLNLVFVASVLGAAAGLVWWAPKIWGRRVPPPLALGAGLALAAGGALVAVPQGIAGLLGSGQPAFSFVRFEVHDRVEALNTVAAIGSVVLAVGAVLVALAVVRAAMGPTDADVDPWGGQTLEWSAPSPPPVGNFAEPVPDVTSATPLLADPSPAAEDEA